MANSKNMKSVNELQEIIDRIPQPPPGTGLARALVAYNLLKIRYEKLERMYADANCELARIDEISQGTKK